MHLAGGSELDGYWIDSHAGAVPEELMDLAVEIVPQLPALGAIIFEVFPSYLPRFDFDAVAVQMERLQELWALRRPARTGAPRRARPVLAAADNQVDDVGAWEDALGRIVVGLEAPDRLGSELGRDRGTEIVKSLLKDFRAGMVCDALRLTVHLLLLTVGEERLRSLLAQFAADQPPALFRSAEGEAFGRYLSQLDLSVEYLPEVVAFERGVLRTLTTGLTTDVVFPYDPLPVLRGLAEARMPIRPQPGNFVVSVTPEDCDEISVEGVAFA